MKPMSGRKPWSLWFGIIPGVVLGFLAGIGLMALMVSLDLPQNTAVRIQMRTAVPLIFSGGLFGALAIHARNKAKGAFTIRHPRHWSPARSALYGAAFGFVLYLVSWLPGFPVPPEQSFSTFVVGLTFWAALITWIRNLFIR
jgi:hypothetical protein